MTAKIIDFNRYASQVNTANENVDLDKCYDLQWYQGEHLDVPRSYRGLIDMDEIKKEFYQSLEEHCNCPVCRAKRGEFVDILKLSRKELIFLLYLVSTGQAELSMPLDDPYDAA